MHIVHVENTYDNCKTKLDTKREALSNKTIWTKQAVIPCKHCTWNVRSLPAEITFR